MAGKQGYSETGWLDGDIGRLDLGYKGPLGYTVIRTIKLYSLELPLKLLYPFVR